MRPHRRQPTRLPRPWDSPGKNTGVGCHFLLQCMKVKVKSLSHVRLFLTPWTAAYQAPPSMGFSRQKYWSGLPLPSPIRVVKTWQFPPCQDLDAFQGHDHPPPYPEAALVHSLGLKRTLESRRNQVGPGLSVRGARLTRVGYTAQIGFGVGVSGLEMDAWKK